MVPNKKNFISPDAAGLVDLDALIPENRMNEVRLVSNLFKGDMILSGLSEGRYVFGPGDPLLLNNPSIAISKIQIALQIVLPEVHEGNEARTLFKEFHRKTNPKLQINGKYDTDTASYVTKFQTRFATTVYNLDVDGIVGTNTIRALDKELEKIKYYDIDKRKTIHNFSKSKPCGYYTVCAKPSPIVDANDPDNTPINATYKAYLYEEPLASAKHIAEIPFNMRVRIIDIIGMTGWCYVEVDPNPDTYTLDVQKNIYLRPQAIPVDRVTTPSVNKVRVDFEYLSNPQDGTLDPSKQYFRYLVCPPNLTAYYADPSEPPVVPPGPTQPPPPGPSPTPSPAPPAIPPLPPDGRIDDAKIAKYYTTGYMLLSDLWTHSEMPDPDAILHKISPSAPYNTLSNLVGNYYNPSGASEQSFYQHAVLYSNNPGGNPTMDQYRLDKNTGTYSDKRPGQVASIRFVSTSQSWVNILNPLDWITDLSPISLAASTWDAWEAKLRGKAGKSVWGSIDIQLVAYKYVWIPGPRYAKSLKETLDISQYKTPLQTIRDYVDTLWNIAVPTGNGSLIDLLDDLWPINMGYNVEAGLGITFGIPVQVFAEKYMYFYRKDADTFKLVRRGKVGGGLNLQAGMGFFMGSGKRTNKQFSEPQDTTQRLGFGGQLGAGLEATLAIGIHEEFEFNFREDHAIAKMLIAIMGIDPLVTVAQVVSQTTIASKFFTNFKMYNLDPSDYRTLVRVEIIRNISGGAGISGGLRLGTGDGESYWNDPDARDTYGQGEGFLLSTITSLLSVTLGWNFNVEFCVGAEIRFKGWKLDESIGIYIPEEVEADVYTEASTALEMSQRLIDAQLFAGSLVGLPIAIPTFNFGLGVKFKFGFVFVAGTFGQIAEPCVHYLPAATPNPDYVNGPHFGFRGFEIYYKSGTFDVYDGPASEVAIAFTPFSSWPPADINDIVNNLEFIRIKRRLGLDTIFGSQYKSSVANNFVDRLASKSHADFTQSKGLIIEGFATFEFKFDGYTARQKITELIQEIQTRDTSDLGRAVWYLVTKFVLGRTPERPEIINSILAQLCEPINLPETKVEAHFGCGVGFAFGASAGVGLTARLQANVSVMVIWDYNMTAEFIALLNPVQYNLCDAAQTFLHEPERVDSRYQYELDPDKSKFSDWYREGVLNIEPLKEIEE
jgi:hypothetical protein